MQPLFLKVKIASKDSQDVFDVLVEHYNIEDLSFTRLGVSWHVCHWKSVTTAKDLMQLERI